MSKYRRVRFFWDTNLQVTTVAMETTQLVLSQFKKLFNLLNWEWNKVYLCQKSLVNVVNWWSYVILIVAVRFLDTVYYYYRFLFNRPFFCTHHTVVRIFQSRISFGTLSSCPTVGPFKFISTIKCILNAMSIYLLECTYRQIRSPS